MWRRFRPDRERRARGGCRHGSRVDVYGPTGHDHRRVRRSSVRASLRPSRREGVLLREFGDRLAARFVGRRSLPSLGLRRGALRAYPAGGRSFLYRTRWNFRRGLCSRSGIEARSLTLSLHCSRHVPSSDCRTNVEDGASVLRILAAKLSLRDDVAPAADTGPLGNLVEGARCRASRSRGSRRLIAVPAWPGPSSSSMDAKSLGTPAVARPRSSTRFPALPRARSHWPSTQRRVPMDRIRPRFSSSTQPGTRRSCAASSSAWPMRPPARRSRRRAASSVRAPACCRGSCGCGRGLRASRGLRCGRCGMGSGRWLRVC